MKKIFYVTFSSIPSSLPSSLQIIKTCENLSKHNNDLTLIKPGTGNNKISIKDYYNLKHDVKIKEFSYFKKFPISFSFYLYCLNCLIFILKNKSDLVITRNLFMCFLILIFRQKAILEIHHDASIEGRLIKFILNYANFLNKQNLIKIIAISNSIKNLFIRKYNVNSNKIEILPSGSSIKINSLPKINHKKRMKIGYFGSISKSKGIYTLIKLSKIDPWNDYYIFGGDKESISKIRILNFNNNLFLKNNIPYKNVKKKMLEMDILTLPYTKIVKSSGDVDDISKYTSPLKLFDYLAVGKIIISSDLKVLKEIINNNNAYFVKNFENIYEWKKIITIAGKNRYKNLILGKNNLVLSKKYDHSTRSKRYLV